MRLRLHKQILLHTGIVEAEKSMQIGVYVQSALVFQSSNVKTARENLVNLVVFARTWQFRFNATYSNISPYIY